MLYPGRCLEPSEIEMLSRVSRSLCKQNGLPFTSPEAARTASHLLKLFMNGLTSEEELLDAAQKLREAAAVRYGFPKSNSGPRRCGRLPA
ncbi:hypothetical protein [Mesorhizobium sp. B2-1-3A]|uniref:hypothetical protein n=1 Tax=Mesorhizobium sp. B2-1-3A TaxID=2589971 RepID=UPI001126CA9B|nr:hypothetical protein [Mesorhizobium sp. B2-1-3A]TPM96617.1 hypothetical protein FJ977_18665 [Mesorhizobium sp. B2-1-3A]